MCRVLPWWAVGGGGSYGRVGRERVDMAPVRGRFGGFRRSRDLASAIRERGMWRCCLWLRGVVSRIEVLKVVDTEQFLSAQHGWLPHVIGHQDSFIISRCHCYCC
jgi:hypothetical protein